MNTVIRQLESGDFQAFFAYLNEQLAENGKNGSPLFQPVPREVLKLPPEKEASFVAGLSKSVGQHGWRRAWIAENDEGEIMGHVDLRSHVEVNTGHRALLGMGVAQRWRRLGLGHALVEFACRWAEESRVIEWVDIEVLCVNKPAIHLYETTGFEKLCEIPDMFRIDDNSEGVIQMARRITE